MRSLCIARFLLPLVLLCIAIRAAGSEGEVRLRFTAFDLPQSEMEFVLRDIAEPEIISEKFAIPTRGFSSPVVFASRQFEICAVQDGATTEDGLPRLHALRTLSLPPPGRAFLVLLLPTVEGAVDFRVLRADDPSFRKGDLQFFNLTPVRIGVVLGDKRFIMEGETMERVSPPQPGEGERSYSVQFIASEDDTAYRFSATRWVLTPQSRSFVFFHRNPSSGRLGYRSIDEYPGWVEVN